MPISSTVSLADKEVSVPRELAFQCNISDPSLNPGCAGVRLRAREPHLGPGCSTPPLTRVGRVHRY